jgi:hypothetical protein
LLALLALPLALLACGGEPDVAAPSPEIPPASVAGSYRVQGTTAVIGSDVTREISGTVILDQEGSSYTATFSLETVYPSSDGPLPAEVVGKGEGAIRGDTLEGTAQTQIVASRVPGLDSRFIMVPPSFSVRIVSNSTGTVNPDGGIQLKIENRGIEGEEYLPTRTTLSGMRVQPRQLDPNPAENEAS